MSATAVFSCVSSEIVYHLKMQHRAANPVLPAAKAVQLVMNVRRDDVRGLVLRHTFFDNSLKMMP